ncbi:hypothetical protein AWH56_003070 [Anaerobacillus isosaccharinicus]|uniref:Uncharacterized protein n=1 Tax=Anaerobacillus isosaccharinicus TaxID=1532552 RepID=A0A1S2L578_9BACI|nr:hypothetical protein [Anaerobacillus isosaccharinicus]MBA5584975.1 hypothetical protein [Anaerobacillus isosaccharinicus]QOY36671.1 hypothetical protein AWH56_003070 [Anaerobacillus isosaccharinicus]
MLRISNIKLRADFDPSKEKELLAQKIQKILKVKQNKILSFSIRLLETFGKKLNDLVEKCVSKRK